MNTRTDSKSTTLETRASLIAKLEILEPVCTDLLANMPATGKQSSSKGIQPLRRDLLKAHNTVNELKETYNDSLGLDFVSESEGKKIRAVASDRKVATDDFFRAFQLESKLARNFREFSSKMQAGALKPLSDKLAEIKEIRQGLFDLYWALPDLGMTYDEWNSLSPIARRGLRKTGRPPLPLECQITVAEIETNELLNEVTRMDSKLKTIEKAIKGVTLSSAGRPSISPIGKDERLIGKIKREMEALNPEDFPSAEEVALQPRLGDTYDARVTRMKSKIADIEARVRAAESELEGVELFRRQLEKLRAHHRDLVLAEAGTKGTEQAKILLATLQNELDQQEVFNQIRALDTNAKESLTHKVNPRETKNRIERLKTNGRLQEAEAKILENIESKILGSRSVRGN